MISPVKIWRNQKKVASLVGKTGTIVAFTMVRVPPADFTNQAPYPVAIVKLKDGTHITAQLVDWKESDLKTGQPVMTVIRKVFETGDGVIPYGIKVRPL